MPEVTYTTDMQLPVEAIWDFVKDMNNWAPFLTGYQKHEIRSDTNSVWTLRGDVGILSRTVHLDVHIVEWDGPRRVAFTLKGLNEMVEGDGSLDMLELDPGSAHRPPGSSSAVPGVSRAGMQSVGHSTTSGMNGDGAPPGSSATGGPSPSSTINGGGAGEAGFVKRFLTWLMRTLFRAKYGTVERPALPPVSQGQNASRLVFRLRMDAGGPTGPLVNAMLEPALLPAAEDLGNKIAAHLEHAHKSAV